MIVSEIRVYISAMNLFVARVSRQWNCIAPIEEQATRCDDPGRPELVRNPEPTGSGFLFHIARS